jgi:hypothetical protein
MSEAAAKPLAMGHLLRRLLMLVALVVVGTGGALWLVAEWLAPRDLRVPEGSPVVQATAPTLDNFRPMEVLERQQVVRGWEVLSAKEADERLRDDEMLLAVEIDGQARCWPLNVMTGPEREIFNDKLAGRSIAATW